MGKGYIKTNKLGLTYIKELIYDVLEEYNRTDYEKRVYEMYLQDLEDKYIDFSTSDEESERLLCSYILKEMSDIKKSINNLKYNITNSQKEKYVEIMDAIKFDDIITSEQYGYLIDLFKMNNFDDKKIVKLLEYVKVHNIITNCIDKKYTIKFSKAYEVLDIIDSGYEKFEKLYINEDNKNQLDNYVNNIIKFYKLKDLDNCKLYLEYIHDRYSIENEYKYILINILQYIRNDMINISTELCVLKNYQDKQKRDELVINYKEILGFYKLVRNALDHEYIDNDTKVR